MGIGAIWPQATAIDDDGELTFHGRRADALLDEFGSPLYLMDTDEVEARATRFLEAARTAFGNSTTHVSFAGKAFLSKEIVRIVTRAGMFVDTCTMGEMRIALAAGAPGRRLVLHGNNKTDEEIALAIEQGFAKIVIDEPQEPARIARIARRLGRRARVMLRVTAGIHAGGHEYISTAHEDQKFGVPLLPPRTDADVLAVLDHLDDRDDVRNHDHADADGTACAGKCSHTERTPMPSEVHGGGEPAGEPVHRDMRYPYDVDSREISACDRELMNAMRSVADGPALAVLQDIRSHEADLELVGIHSHIGSQIHDAQAFIEAARRMMLLRRTFYATDAYTLPEVDLGGGYSVAYTDDEDSMDVESELGRLADAVESVNRVLGMPAPVLSFEPGRWIVAPAGVTLYRVGAIKHVPLPSGVCRADGEPLEERVYVSVDGGMSDNIRPALYGAEYTARLASRRGEGRTMVARVVGMHCESGDVIVHECQLPADLRRGDILAVPVTGAYGRTMASNYNQALIPAVVAVSAADAHVMIRRQRIEDILDLDQG